MTFQQSRFVLRMQYFYINHFETFRGENVRTAVNALEKGKSVFLHCGFPTHCCLSMLCNALTSWNVYYCPVCIWYKSQWTCSWWFLDCLVLRHFVWQQISSCVISPKINPLISVSLPLRVALIKFVLHACNVSLGVIRLCEQQPHPTTANRLWPSFV